MKTFLSTLFTLAFGGAMMLTIVCLPATAQILFQDDFSKAATSEKKWAFLQGKWTVKGSALKQDAPDDETVAVISDDFWDDTWSEYIFEVTARKFRGKNGVRIFWRINDDMQPRKKVVSSFGGKLVGKTRSHLSLQTSGELLQEKRGPKRDTRWEMIRSKSKSSIKAIS